MQKIDQMIGSQCVSECRGEDRSLTESLLFDDRVEWAEQQFDKVVLRIGLVFRFPGESEER